MVRAVIVSTARTGLAKSFRGGFNATHGAALGGHVIAAALKKANIDPGQVEDVIMGCGMPEGETGMNIARNAAMWADCPVTVSGQTVNRFCSSGLQVQQPDSTPPALCPQHVHRLPGLQLVSLPTVHLFSLPTVHLFSLLTLFSLGILSLPTLYSLAIPPGRRGPAWLSCCRRRDARGTA
jgi:hypothetical protein